MTFLSKDRNTLARPIRRRLPIVPPQATRARCSRQNTLPALGPLLTVVQPDLAMWSTLTRMSDTPHFEPANPVDRILARVAKQQQAAVRQAFEATLNMHQDAMRRAVAGITSIPVENAIQAHQAVVS